MCCCLDCEGERCISLWWLGQWAKTCILNKEHKRYSPKWRIFLSRNIASKIFFVFIPFFTACFFHVFLIYFLCERKCEEYMCLCITFCMTIISLFTVIHAGAVHSFLLFCCFQAPFIFWINFFELFLALFSLCYKHTNV